MSHSRIAIAVALSLTAACTSAHVPEAPDPAVEVEAVSREAEPASDQLLLTLALSPTHVVRFTETVDGYREVEEELHADIDRGRRSLSDLDTAGRSFAEIHRYLLPSAPIPDALVAADARAAQRAPAPVEEVGPEEEAIGDALHRGPDVDGAVNWDWNADALWFKQGFYTGGTDGYFGVNAGGVSVTKKRKTDWYKATAFNQSFESPARFRVDRSKACGILGLELCWNTKVDTNVGNRYLHTYNGEGPKYRKAWMNGSGATARVGLAVRWTKPMYGSPSPPAACGGHTQYACSSWPRCKPGLVEYNGGCYGCGTVGQACCKDWGDIPTNGGWTGVCAQGYCGYPGGYCNP
jgi:hypothetical protein